MVTTYFQSTVTPVSMSVASSNMTILGVLGIGVFIVCAMMCKRMLVQMSTRHRSVMRDDYEGIETVRRGGPLSMPFFGFRSPVDTHTYHLLRGIDNGRA